MIFFSFIKLLSFFISILSPVISPLFVRVGLSIFTFLLAAIVPIFSIFLALTFKFSTAFKDSFFKFPLNVISALPAVSSLFSISFEVIVTVSADIFPVFTIFSLLDIFIFFEDIFPLFSTLELFISTFLFEDIFPVFTISFEFILILFSAIALSCIFTFSALIFILFFA